jgi:hypothetical protein
MILLKELLDHPETGRPLKKVLYRGDDKKFAKFDPAFIGKSTMSNTEGFWFTDSADAAQFYGEHVRAFVVTMSNPLVFTGEDFKNGYPKGTSYFAKLAKQKGYDGVIILDIIDGDRRSNVYCVFNASQITPATAS